MKYILQIFFTFFMPANVHTQRMLDIHIYNNMYHAYYYINWFATLNYYCYYYLQRYFLMAQLSRWFPTFSTTLLFMTVIRLQLNGSDFSPGDVPLHTIHTPYHTQSFNFFLYDIYTHYRTSKLLGHYIYIYIHYILLGHEGFHYSTFFHHGKHRMDPPLLCLISLRPLPRTHTFLSLNRN